MNTHIAMGEGREFDMVRQMLDVWGDLAPDVGSDVALLRAPHGSQIVVSTDTSVEGVHFRREWITARQVGYRATVAALSDLAAAGAEPIGILVALNISPTWLDEISEIAAGIGEALVNTAPNARILGGDTSRATEFCVNVTVMGEASRPLSRAGARAGDHLFVTGELGLSASALAKLQRGAPLSGAETSRFFQPRPRLREGIWLRERGATAGIDISDGLGSELRHIAAASGVLLQVDLGQVPVAKDCVAIDVMRSGEEYELLVSAPEGMPVQEFRAAFGTALTRIGCVAEGPAGVELRSAGQLIALPHGHDHF